MAQAKSNIMDDLPEDIINRIAKHMYSSGERRDRDLLTERFVRFVEAALRRHLDYLDEQKKVGDDETCYSKWKYKRSMEPMEMTIRLISILKTYSANAAGIIEVEMESLGKRIWPLPNKWKDEIEGTLISLANEEVLTWSYTDGTHKICAIKYPRYI